MSEQATIGQVNEERMMGQWQAAGVWLGGTVAGTALAARGDFQALMATRVGVFAQRQHGTGWEALATGLADPHVVAVAFAGAASGAPLALAATATGRLYARAAAAWEEWTSWAGLGVGTILCPSPAFAEDGTLFVGTPGGVFRTLDRGATWESCNFGLLDEEMLCLACAPDFATSQLLWAGSAGGGLYRSRNGARAWRESGFGLPDAPVQALAVSPDFAADQTLWAGLEGHGIYVSRDGGESWAALGLGERSVNSLACVDAARLWAATEAGVIQLDGRSGAVLAQAATEEMALAVSALPDDTVLVGLFGRGAWLSRDGGATWAESGLALHAPPVVAALGDDLLALDVDGLLAQVTAAGAVVELPPASPDTVFDLAGGRDDRGKRQWWAATGTGLSQWDAAAQAWATVADDTFHEEKVLAVDVSPRFAEDGALLAHAHGGHLLLSRDRGQTWAEISGPWGGEPILQMQFGPRGVGDLLALTVTHKEEGHYGVTLWQRSQWEAAWETLASLSSGVPVALVAWPEDAAEQALFLATQHRVVKLFTPAGGELQVQQHFFDEGSRVTALTAADDYATTGRLWAATNAGVFASADRGASWAQVAELPAGQAVVWLAAGAAGLAAVTLGGQVWRAAQA